MQQLPLGVRLRSSAVFASYFAGPNEEAVAALETAAGVPIWLYGNTGTGKTHLLQASCAAAHGAAYFPLDQVPRLPPEALQGFENVGLLCIDDAHSIAGNATWEGALFALFNAAAEAQTRLVFAATAPPGAIPWTLPDWASRAAACAVYGLRDLDDAQRIQALRLRASQRGLQLPIETAEYLLRRMPRSLTRLFEVLDTLDEAALIAQRRLTVPFIREALQLGPRDP
jgi:DnaA-homolog protein